MTNTRSATWTTIGTAINTQDVQEALRLSGLDYTVQLDEVYRNFGGKQIQVPEKKAIVRSNDGHLYNVLSDKYTPIQNVDAFDFLNSIDDDITFVKAGETNSGLIYIIGHVKKVSILGDDFDVFAIFQNGHNGRFQLSMTMCPLRLVCENQFNIAFKESESTFKIRHTKNIESKVQIATETLQSIADYMKVFEAHAEQYAGMKLSETQITKFINFMFPEKETMTPALLNRLEDQKNAFYKAYNANDNGNFKGTVWGLINGLTDYITHKPFMRKVEDIAEKKFMDTILFSNDLNNGIKFLTEIAA